MTPHQKLIVHLSGLFSFAIALVFSWIVLVSFYSAEPLSQRAAIVYPIAGPDNAPYKVFVEERTIEGYRSESIVIHRKLYKNLEPDLKLTIEGGSFNLNDGTNTIVRPIFMPPYAKGYWCSSATVTWWPSWSQREFSKELTDVCFIVE